jgi:hypothetical protein
VNCHEELVAACKEAERLLSVYLEKIISPADRLMAQGTVIKSALKPLRAALAKVEGGAA